MKPLKLVMNDFGPYKGRNEIDFTQLKSSLYLISGPTGAGKTYIFDAICFALYGQLSGDNRTTDDVRCQYAEPADLTSVEFVFEYQGINYEILRLPKQMRQSARRNADGNYPLVNQVASAKLSENGVISYTKITEVDNRLKEILSLDRDQFKMTMMIAQGDFYKLINATTNERKDIFRKILNTGSIKDFIDKLDNMKRAAFVRLKTQEENINTLRKQLKSDDTILKKQLEDDVVLYSTIKELVLNELQNDIERRKVLDEYRKQADERLNIATREVTAAKYNNENKTKYDALVVKKEELDKSRGSIQELESKVKLAKAATTVINNFELLEKAKVAQKQTEGEIFKHNQELQSLFHTSERAHMEYRVAKLALEQKEALVAQKQGLEKALRNLKRYEDAQELLKESEKNSQEYSKLLKDEIENAAILNQRYEEHRRKFVAFRGLEQKKEIETTIKASQEALKRLEVLDKEVLEYLNLTKKHQDITDDIESAINERNAFGESFRKFEDRFFASQAGILASKLEKETPCPVCGSTNHPHLAVLASDVLSESDIKKMKSEFETKEKHIEFLVEQAKQMVKNIASLEKSIGKVIDDEFDTDTIIDIVADRKLEHQAVIKNLNESLQPILTSIKEMSQEEDFAMEWETSKRQESQVRADFYRDKIKLHDEKITASLALINEIGEDIKDRSKDSLNTRLIETINNLVKIDKQYDLALEQTKVLSTKQDRLHGAIKSLKDNLQRLEKDVLNAFESLDKILSASPFTTVDEAKVKQLNEETLEHHQQTIQKFVIESHVNNESLKDALKANHNELKIVDLNVLEDERSALENKRNEAFARYSEVDSKIIFNSGLIKDIEKVVAASAEDSNIAAELESLYATASGNISGQTKIDFEVFYQAQVFQKILDVASPKFNRMSDGRYVFARGESYKKSGKTGLEVSVVDQHSGKVRSASSLSGGESFQASLALALSFSEVIQVQAGGVELNSMFIDEGFGALDAEALEKTKKTLFEVGESANRLVGIISHVEELENSIPTKIVVTKTEQGSKAVIVNE